MGTLNLLFSSAAVGAEAGARTGVGVARLAIRRTPSLVLLGARATVGMGAGAGRAEVIFRDELLMLLDDAGEIAWRQARRARDELGARTSLREQGAGSAGPEVAGQNGGTPRRHRVKA